MRSRALAVGAGAVLLLVGTVLVFRAFDLHSHSASDTLRPFVITMAPVWIVAILAASSAPRSPLTPGAAVVCRAAVPSGAQESRAHGR